MDLKLGHHAKDGVEIIDVQAKSTCIPRRAAGAAHRPGQHGQLPAHRQLGQGRVPRLRRPRVLVGGLRRVRAHDGSLDLVCTQQRILKIFRITGLTEVFGIYETADQAIAAA